jgi:hypothetical protein
MIAPTTPTPEPQAEPARFPKHYGTVTLLRTDGAVAFPDVPADTLLVTRALAGAGADGSSGPLAAGTASARLCEHFEGHGTCNRGVKCRFAHRAAAAAAPAVVAPLKPAADVAAAAEATDRVATTPRVTMDEPEEDEAASAAPSALWRPQLKHEQAIVETSTCTATPPHAASSVSAGAGYIPGADHSVSSCWSQPSPQHHMALVQHHRPTPPLAPANTNAPHPMYAASAPVPPQAAAAPLQPVMMPSAAMPLPQPQPSWPLPPTAPFQPPFLVDPAYAWACGGGAPPLPFPAAAPPPPVAFCPQAPSFCPAPPAPVWAASPFDFATAAF